MNLPKNISVFGFISNLKAILYKVNKNHLHWKQLGVEKSHLKSYKNNIRCESFRDVVKVYGEGGGLV